MTSGLDVIFKTFERPDDVRDVARDRFEIIRIGGLTIGRATYEPGWKRSEAEDYANATN